MLFWVSYVISPGAKCVSFTKIAIMDTSLPKNANKIQEVQENTTKAKDALGQDKLLTAHDTNLSHQMDKLALPHKEKKLIADGHLPDSKFKPGAEKNEKGQIDKVTYPDGNSRSFEYNEKGEITKVTSTSGNGSDFIRQQNPDGSWSDKWAIVPKSGTPAYEVTLESGKDLNGNPCQDISVDANGNLKWRFADGREHSVDATGAYHHLDATRGARGETLYRDDRTGRINSSDDNGFKQYYEYDTDGKDSVGNIVKVTNSRNEVYERRGNQFVQVQRDNNGAEKILHVWNTIMELDQETGLPIYRDTRNPADYNDSSNDKMLPPLPGDISVRGEPTISPEKIDAVLRAKHSPVAGLGQFIYDEGVRTGINPAVALAFFQQESCCGTHPQSNFPHTNNWGNIRENREGHVGYKGFRVYENPEDGIRDWYNLIDKGRPYRNCSSLSQILRKYAPNSDGNNEAAYAKNVKRNVALWSDLKDPIS
jgi:hypothetical protein